MNLLLICLTAFVAVFVLLALLAGVMHLITMIFPFVKKVIDPVVVATITASYQQILPGTRVTRIEEIK